MVYPRYCNEMLFKTDFSKNSAKNRLNLNILASSKYLYNYISVSNSNKQLCAWRNEPNPFNKSLILCERKWWARRCKQLTSVEEVAIAIGHLLHSLQQSSRLFGQKLQSKVECIHLWRPCSNTTGNRSCQRSWAKRHKFVPIKCLAIGIFPKATQKSTHFGLESFGRWDWEDWERSKNRETRRSWDRGRHVH